MPTLAARLATLLCAALAALALALLMVPASAAAASHPFLSKLIGAYPDPGSSHPPNGFEDACGVALDSHGDLYVSDYHHDAIDLFGPSGEYLTQIAGEDPGNGPCGLAVDAAGRLYVNNWRQDVVRLTPSSYPPSASTTYGSATAIDSGGTATGVAIDPTSGNVYVDDGTYVAEREPSGALLAKIGEGTLGEGYGVAVSGFPATAGYVYVPDAADRTVEVYDPATSLTSPVMVIDGQGTPQAGFRYLLDAEVTVDNNPASPSYGHVFVLDDIQHNQTEHPAAVLDEFNAAGAYRGQIARWAVIEGQPPELVDHWITDAEPSGLAIGSTGEVYVTNGNDEGAVLDVFGPTAPAATLVVSKTGAGVGTVRSEPAGINCPDACVAEYDLNSQVTLTATPATHSKFTGWSGCTSEPSPTECRVTMSAAESVEAQFAPIPQQTLALTVGGSGTGTIASSPTGIECSSAGGGTCSEHFDSEGPESTVTLTATPATHSKFTGWSGPDAIAEGCDQTGATLTCAVEMSAAKSVGAEFGAIPQQTLAVEITGPGVVVSSPAGISCPGTCSEHFDSEGPQSTVTLTAVPAAHDQVAWSGCGSQPSPTECEVTMSEARAVGASFTPILHTLTISVLGEGQVSASSGQISGCGAPGGTCSGSYPEGEAVTLTATATAGSNFAGWSGACGGAGPCHVTIEADTAVSANFAAIPPPPIEPLPARLELGKLAVKGASATLKLSVSGPGAVVATGRRLKRSSAHASGAGALSLRLALNGAGRRALARAGHGRLKVRVTLIFTPSDGGAAATDTRVVTFVSGHGRKHHSKHRRH